MVRSMISGMNLPKEFWAYAVKWSVFVLNRSPTDSLKNTTPEEAWCKVKPAVHFFRVFGCVAYAHVPSALRKKLDNRSIKCIHLGVSEESKAYKLYDPVTKKILTSRDVKFVENEQWKWGDKSNSESEGEIVELERNEGVENTNNTGETENEGGVGNTEEAGRSGGLGNNDEIENIEFDENETGVNEHDTEENEGRTRRRPAYLQDYYTREDELEQLERLQFTEVVDWEKVEEVSLAAITDDPLTFEQASKSEKWRRAMDIEIESIERNGTWELVELPHGASKIGVKWVFKTKLNEKGEIEKHKARLVAKGYSQKHDIDYKEVFAPVARWDTIRTILAVASLKNWFVYQLDVKSAFLHGELEETVYVEQPLGYVKKGNEQKVYKLHKALYGLKQAPRAWYSKIDAYFAKEQFEKCPSEHTLYVKRRNSDLIVVSLYVDDLIFTSNSEKFIGEFKSSMKENFEMTDLGRMSHFLGVEVIQNSSGISIGQGRYAREILKRFDMEFCKPVQSPIATGCKLSKEGNGKEVDGTEFKQLVGCLMYLTVTRPDIVFAVSLLSRYMSRPTEMHLQAAKRVLRYLKGSLDLGIQYNREGRHDFIAYTDSDYAGDVDDRKSTSGYVFLLGAGAISWSSKKQPVVTLSTTEAEFIAAAYCVCQAIWLRRILDRIDHKQKGVTVIHCDNVSTIKLSKNPVLHGRSKHIDIRFHFLRNLVKEEIIDLVHCRSENQIADIMTKPLKSETFLKLRTELGMKKM